MSKNLDVIMLIDFYGDMLTEKQHAFLNYYYNEDLSLAEIAENEGITRQGVRDQIKRAEAQLLSLEEKCCYCKKFMTLKELSAKYTDGDKNAITEILDIINNL